MYTESGLYLSVFSELKARSWQILERAKLPPGGKGSGLRMGCGAGSLALLLPLQGPGVMPEREEVTTYVLKP
jgi:hypothetical protein